jgi:hypothetical protein
MDTSVFRMAICEICLPDANSVSLSLFSPDEAGTFTDDQSWSATCIITNKHFTAWDTAWKLQSAVLLSHDGVASIMAQDIRLKSRKLAKRQPRLASREN